MGLLVSASPAAYAAGSESGYIYDTDCPQPSDPWVVGRTTGSTDILGPGKSSYVNYFNGSTMQNRYVAGTLVGGYWLFHFHRGAGVLRRLG